MFLIISGLIYLTHNYLYLFHNCFNVIFDFVSQLWLCLFLYHNISFYVIIIYFLCHKAWFFFLCGIIPWSPFKCPVNSIFFYFSFLFFSFLFLSHLLILRYLVKSWRCTLARSCEKEQQKHHINKLMASLSALPTRLFLIGSDLRAVPFPQLLTWNFFLPFVSLLSRFRLNWSPASHSNHKCSPDIRERCQFLSSITNM